MLKKNLSLLLVLFSLLSLSSAYAENKPTDRTAAMWDQSKLDALKKESLAKNQEMIAKSKEMSDFYKKDSEFRKASNEKRMQLWSQIKELRAKKVASKDAAEKKALDTQIAGLNGQIETLNVEIVKQDIVTAEFALKRAQERLDRSKKKLAEIEQKKA